jgi:hypothetical protein
VFSPYDYDVATTTASASSCENEGEYPGCAREPSS